MAADRAQPEHHEVKTPRRVASVEVGAERETARGWAHEVVVGWMDDSESMHDVRLSWIDHDHLSGGACPPSKVASAVARVAAESLGNGRLPRKFDVSTIRRLVESMDDRVQRML